MKVAIIAPTKNLNLFAAMSSFHLVLAHQYELDNRYRRFYQGRVAAGDHVILDNSAYELQESISAKRLLTCALDLNPTAVFLPDARFDKEKTLKVVEESVQLFANRGWDLLGVPQGNDLESILECYQKLGTLGLSGIGLYEEIGEVAGMKSRYQFLQYLEDHDMVYPNFYYHLLGMEENVHEVRNLRTFDWVDSIDSTKPVVYGMHEVRFWAEQELPEYPHRPEGYFEMDLERWTSHIQHNIRQVLLWAKY